MLKEKTEWINCQVDLFVFLGSDSGGFIFNALYLLSNQQQQKPQQSRIPHQTPPPSKKSPPEYIDISANRIFVMLALVELICDSEYLQFQILPKYIFQKKEVNW